MSTIFSIEYRTRWGEELFLNTVERDGSYTPHPMNTADGIVWTCTMEVKPGTSYFYCVHEHGRVTRSEGMSGNPATMYHRVAECQVFKTPDTRAIRDSWHDWDPSDKVAGTLVPVFALRSRRSFGVGDFGDLRLMVDWLARTSQHVLQILPINDTCRAGTWEDSYPYSCVSVFALHPQYMNLSALPRLRRKAEREHFETLRQELNALPQIDYERVMAAKTAYLEHLYAQEGRKVLKSEDYSAWVEQEREWLEPYARWKGGDTDFTCYVQYLLSRQLSEVHEYARQQGVLLKGDIPIGVSRHGADVMQYPQYFNLSGQAGAPPDDFARDGQNWGFPTYNWEAMARDGYQWWRRRFQNMAKYFDAYRIDHVLGFFRIWEIPAGETSGKEGQFQPAKGLTTNEVDARMGESAECFKDSERQGSFARFGGMDWEALFLHDHKAPSLWHPRIDARQTPAFAALTETQQQQFNALYEDFFYHRNTQLWYDEAMQKLTPLRHATHMLCCAEDLGMVPECVPWVMRRLEMLSLEMESMPKGWERFGRLEQNPYLSVATISSHDTPTLRMWWDEDEARTETYYHDILHHHGKAPHPLTGELAAEIIEHHMRCPSMLCIISLQDWLATDEGLRLPDASAERVNIPANPHHYWRYRMHLDLEDLLRNKAFATKVRNLVQKRVFSAN